MNRFKHLLISYGCTDNFHMLDNQIHVVCSRGLAS